jgi:hypothetical protein
MKIGYVTRLLKTEQTSSYKLMVRSQYDENQALLGRACVSGVVDLVVCDVPADAHTCGSAYIPAYNGSAYKALYYTCF